MRLQGRTHPAQPEHRIVERELTGGVVEKRYYDKEDKLVEIRTVQPADIPSFKRRIIPRSPGTFGGE